MIYKNLYKNDLNFIERNKHLILYNPGESINPLQILPILLLCIKHTCSQNEFLPFQPLHHQAATGKTKELSKDARDITVDLHKVKRPSVRSSCNFLPIPIISNYFQLFENRWNLKWSLSRSCLMNWGWSWKKCWISPKLHGRSLLKIWRSEEIPDENNL